MFAETAMDILQKGDFCRCCLLNTNDTENELIKMSQTFNYQNQKISLYDGYFETTGCQKEFSEIQLADNKICQFCVNELENAYVFKKLCLEANQILKRKFEEAKDGETHDTPLSDKKKAGKQVANDEEEENDEVETSADEEVAGPSKNARKRGRGKGAASDSPQPSTSTANDSASKSTRKRKATIEVGSPKTPVRRQKTKSKEPSVSTPASDEEMPDLTLSLTATESGDDNTQELKTPDTEKTAIWSKIVEQNDGKFHCDICQKVTTSKQYMYRHIRTHFTKSPDSAKQSETPGHYPCKECERVFTCRSGLTKHFNKEHLHVRQVCEVCNKVFKSRSGLQSHTKSNHLNMRFECLICAQEFKAVNALKEHNRIQHENVRFDCKLCGHQCRKIQDLWVHSFQHRGFLPFCCKKCDYKTAVKSNYKFHLKKQHSIPWNEKMHGYNKETREEVLSYVRD